MKTDLTRTAEQYLWDHTNKMGVFGCFEVTMGFAGKERVDYITYETNTTIRCYEIKVTLADLKSSAKQTFIGDYNYLVVPQELWESILSDGFIYNRYVNHRIGVLVFDGKSPGIKSVRKAKKQNVSMSTKGMVLESMVRSLSREVEKYYNAKPFWEVG